ncbi:hypothetical protein NDJ00_23615 [Vibrio parahaemolyticus]|uniref:hypothetical protein n=1 Tax=Vibrio parahaemolyticus TaxID=670 RepID=UPI0006C10855|nr:hypothetical protein [Vibrio parahaemolyticus]KOY41125.1 hypothetical protein ACX10_02120 [Vibrio parahaemolyticus]MCS0117169.1 hypothetical protein [Vibrio parahaemolyticus]
MKNNVRVHLFEKLGTGTMFLAHNKFWISYSKTVAKELWNDSHCSFSLDAIDALVIPVSYDFPNLGDHISKPSHDNPELSRDKLAALLNEEDRYCFNTAEALSILCESYSFYENCIDSNIKTLSHELLEGFFEKNIETVKSKMYSKPFDSGCLSEFTSLMLHDCLGLEPDQFSEKLRNNNAGHFSKWYIARNPEADRYYR